MGLGFYSSLPTPSGKYSVGISKTDLTFPNGDRVQFYIWYPAKPAPDAKPRSVYSKNEAKAFGTVYQAMGLPRFLAGKYKRVKTSSFEDAPISDPGPKPFNLIVFNHGGGMTPLQNFSQMQEFASHGYVVLSICHPGESAGIAWNNGEITPFEKSTLRKLKTEDGIQMLADFLLSQDNEFRRTKFNKLSDYYSPTLGEMTRSWARRTSQILDHLEFGGAQTASIIAHTNLKEIGFMGMSLGGSVTHLLCHNDKRAAAGINLDGMNWEFDLAGVPMKRPFLQIYGDPMAGQRELKAKASPNAHAPTEFSSALKCPNDYYYEDVETRGQSSDIIRLIWKGAKHMFFTDQSLAGRNRKNQADYANLTSICLTFFNTIFSGQFRSDFDGLIDKHVNIVRQKL